MKLPLVLRAFAEQGNTRHELADNTEPPIHDQMSTENRTRTRMAPAINRLARDGGTAILALSYGSCVRKHELIFRELRDRNAIMYEYFLAPAQMILPDDTARVAYFETFIWDGITRFPMMWQK